MVTTPAKKKIALGADHAGFELKEFLKKNVSTVVWIDVGPANADRVDYPDYAEKVAVLVRDHRADAGVLVCGSGIGVSIAANKINGIRAAVVESLETAKLSRAHNDANVLCLGARILEPARAKEMVLAWLETPFEGGRHQGRVEKITALENK